MLQGKKIVGYGLELREVSASDLPTLRRWRNSSEIRYQMVDTSYISPRNQRLWFENTRGSQSQAHWVARFQGVRVGYMNLKGEGKLSLQPRLDGGLYIGNSDVRHGLLGYALALIQLEIVFEHLIVQEYRTSFRETNRSAKRFNQQLGYTELCSKDGFIWVSITADAHAQARNRIIRYFNNSPGICVKRDTDHL
ncbi:flagellar modification protein FlmH [Gammaproteobacteria bacterium]|nr:flagellar modification protein FlmH [Gammaproteobacteria bacterium]